jgi:hypothetical protein
MRRVLLVLALLVPAPTLADTVVLKGGKKRDNVVVSQEGDEWVVVNPFNSSCPDMTYGVERIAREKVADVVHASPPLFDCRMRSSLPRRGDGDGRLELAKFCEAHKLAEERDRELKLALCEDPTDAVALKMLGATAWQAWSKGNPLADADLRRLEQEYVKLEKPAERQAQWEQMTAKGTTRSRTYLERARRSAKFAPGRRDKVPLTVRSEASPGATYCIYVPSSYDPLVATGLVVALHGGGRGGADATVVTGNGEEAMNFYVDVAEERGVLVVCPSALAAPWSDRKNEVLLGALLDEMRMLYDVDENRIWLTGHSMGGFGAWHYGPLMSDVWAAFAPCAGAGGPTTNGLPVYVYHGSDDQIVTVGSDRAAAAKLKDDKADFVYTELDKVGHGFPDWVRHDIFRFFAGHWRDEGKKRAVWPRSSFDRKPSKDEIRCFGDPGAVATPTSSAPADAKLSDLIDKLEKGGGLGVEASSALAARKDAATLAAVGHVLRSKKATSDARVLAARTIGELGLPDGVKVLATECACDDFRVLDAVVASLGRLGGKDAAEPLVRAAKQLGAFWEKANQGGQFDFTEYEIRCQSFAALCDALAAAGDAAAALPVLDKEVVARVYVPKSAYAVPIDDRFVAIPPRARLTLMTHLAACLGKLKDPRGKALLEAAKAAWSKEPALVEQADAGIAAIG